MLPTEVRTARLRRNKTGDVIHRALCPHVKAGSVPWDWAEKNADEDWKKTAPWLAACKTCDPPSPLNSDDETPEVTHEQVQRAAEMARGGGVMGRRRGKGE